MKPHQKNLQIELLSIPAVWTEPQDSGLRNVRSILDHLASRQRMAALCGLLQSVDGSGVRWLKQASSRDPEFRCRLLLAVWPTCPTHAPELVELSHLQAQTEARCEFRVFVTTVSPFTPGHSLCFLGGSAGETLLLTGSESPWCPAGRGAGAPNLVWQSDSLTIGQWSAWFDAAWEDAVPLSERTAHIPGLVPAKGSAEATAIWRTYQQTCEQSRVQPDLFGELTGEQGQPEAGPRKPQTVSEELGLQPGDALYQRIARLYLLGKLAHVDETTRQPPLTVAANAKLFGVEAAKKVGSVKRRVNYDIGAFDDEDQSKLDVIRESTSHLLPRFSYSLGRGVHWMPDAAWPLLQLELSQMDRDGQELLRRLVKDGATEYIKGRMPRIKAEANEMYQDFRPGQALSAADLRKVTDGLTERIQCALDSGLVAKLSPLPISFDNSSGTRWVSQWGQAYALLNAIATYARKAISTRRFFFLGLVTQADDLLDAMDVCGDWILQPEVRWHSRSQALKELEDLDRIAEMKPEGDASIDDLRKRQCQAIFGLMETELGQL